jgi:nucleotide-binding universal stress UspA family protein
MKNGQILVHVEPGKVSEARLRYAISMAQGHELKLIGLAVRLTAGAAVSTTVGDVHTIAALCEASDECCRMARGQFETITSGCGVAGEWVEATGVPLDVIAAEAGRADLVVLGQNNRPDPDGGVYELNPADAILACGAPALVVPAEAPASFTARRILLAWKSSPQAARAAKDALPLLKRAEAVVMTEIVPESFPSKYEISAQAMADYLASHDVPVSLDRIPAVGDAGAQILQAAADNACDLVVAGAYGHSRLREWALGGVTRTLLTAASLPCLLSH